MNISRRTIEKISVFLLSFSIGWIMCDVLFSLL